MTTKPGSETRTEPSAPGCMLRQAVKRYPEERQKTVRAASIFVRSFSSKRPNH